MPEPSRAVVENVEARLIWAYERRIAPEHCSMATPGAAETVCWLILAGEVRVESGGATTRARAGEWLFKRAAAGWQRFSPRARLLSIRFRLRRGAGDPVFRRARDLVFAAERQPELLGPARELSRLLLELRGRRSLLVARDALPLAQMFRIESAFHAWLAAYVDAMRALGEAPDVPRVRDARVARALALIAAHPMREKFAEPDLARRCGLSVNQLARLFRRETGDSLFAAYERRRLELAQHALEESDLPVKEIAFELGFHTPGHFSAWFARKVGRTATAHRAAAGSRLFSGSAPH